MNSQRLSSQKTPAYSPRLRLPKEHGATVAFGLSALLSLVISPMPVISGMLIAGSVFILLAAYTQIESSLLRLKHLQMGTKQAVGMAAASALPLVFTVALCGLDATITMKSILFVASTLLATAAVQNCAKSANMNPRAATIAAALLFAASLMFHPPLSALCLAIPFMVQAIWLQKQKNPSFKALGIAETLCLLGAALVIWLI